MHGVDRLEWALAAATRLGYSVRQEWLGGAGGGACELRGQKRLFVDLAQTPAEQLASVIEALSGETGWQEALQAVRPRAETASAPRKSA